MKHLFSIVLFAGLGAVANPLHAQGTNSELTSANTHTTAGKPHGKKQLFIDVHYLGAGKVSYEAVAQAHAKDLATEGKYRVEFLKYWVDTAQGAVYCLSSAFDTASIVKTHAAAHGLLPAHVYPVTAGEHAVANGGKNLYLDFHEFGPGNVKAADVAGAHQKDLAVQKKYGVNLINYWVDEKAGVVMCLAEAPDADALIKTHKEAHGLIPKSVEEVKQGN